MVFAGEMQRPPHRWKNPFWWRLNVGSVRLKRTNEIPKIYINGYSLIYYCYKTIGTCLNKKMSKRNFFYINIHKKINVLKLIFIDEVRMNVIYE